MTANKIRFWDLECQNHPYFGAIASPRNPLNFVVLNGWADDVAPLDGKIEYIRNDTPEQELSRPWMTIPDDVWLLVMHNAPFEMDWLLVRQRPEILKFLKRGGRIFCTAYAHYLLSNQLDHYPALDEVAPLYGGAHKVDGVKALWNAGVLTADIDPALLLEYLISPANGDVANTRQMFYQQAAQLQARGMWNMALERMEGMVFNCFAMDAGLYVNREVAAEQMQIGAARLLELQTEFRSFRTALPPDVEFKESSDFHMSAWLFGGPIKYRHRVPSFNDDGSPKFEKADFVKMVTPAELDLVLVDDKITFVSNGNTYTMPPEEASFDFGFEFDRYKAGKNKGQIKVHRLDTAEPKLIWAETYYQCPPLVDLRLLGAELEKEFRKEFSGKRKLMDDTPVYSTGKDCIEKLRVQSAFTNEIRDLLTKLDEFAKLDKDMGTYYLREELDDTGAVAKQSGMLQYLTDKSIVHHVLNCTATITSRLSSNKPNMQNLPRGDTSNVKKMFTSRFGNDGVIIEADYSALEVVTLAAFSKDTNLVKALMDGIDMHCMRLSQQLKEPYADVLKKCKDAGHPDHAKYSTMRTDIKPKAFAYQYGATARGIAFATGCTVEDAQAFIDAEKALFPEVESFYDTTITPVVQANSQLHREQRDDNSWRVYKRGYWQAPGGTCYSFREYESNQWVNGKKIEGMAYKPTQIRNYPIQGESGFFVQGVCGLVVRWLIANDFFGGKVFIINTVHDALYFDCHKSVLDLVASGVKQIMESLPQHFNAAHGYDLQVPFPAAVEFGSSMYEKIHWHPGVLEERLAA